MCLIHRLQTCSEIRHLDGNRPHSPKTETQIELILSNSARIHKELSHACDLSSIFGDFSAEVCTQRSVWELPFSTQNYSYSGPGGETISPSESVKDLGVLVSSNCTWSEHIGSITTKARRMRGWALSAFRDRSDYTMLTLLKSIVRPQVEYCCPLWNPVRNFFGKSGVPVQIHIIIMSVQYYLHE
eukprot:sb/3471403/